LGIGDWGLGIGPNPQSPIPNPQSPIPKKYFKYFQPLHYSIFFFPEKKFNLLNKFYFILLYNKF
jgi:hypothetical protein